MPDYHESPAEECLGERLRRMINQRTKLETQVWVETKFGRYRMDMLLTDPRGRRICIEVDGRDFHDGVHDHWRTVFIVGAREAQVVYRVSGHELKVDFGAVLAGVIAVEPQCFKPEELERWRDAPSNRDNWSDGREEVESDEIFDAPQRYAHGLRHRSAIACRLRFCARRSHLAAIRPYYEFAWATGLTDIAAISQKWELAHPG